MASATNIEWTDFNWNFLRGCSRVSEGCRNCYAESVAARFSQPGQPYEGLAGHVDHKPRWTGEISFHEDILLKPLTWRKPRKVFVNSMSDLFHEKVTDEMLDKAFAVMALTPQHTYQILTKRPERMRDYLTPMQNVEITDYLPDSPFQPVVSRAVRQMFSVLSAIPNGERLLKLLIASGHLVEMEPEVFWFAKWPLPNVWLGVSCEDQKTADERIPLLLQTPAAVRWVSAEPLLGPLEFRPTRGSGWDDWLTGQMHRGPSVWSGEPHLDWVVVGGESGPNARPFDIQWARDIIAQCKAADVPVFVKQLGAKPRHTFNEAGENVRFYFNDRKGGDLSEWPEDLRVREFPT